MKNIFSDQTLVAWQGKIKLLVVHSGSSSGRVSVLRERVLLQPLLWSRPPPPQPALPSQLLHSPLCRPAFGNSLWQPTFWLLLFRTMLPSPCSPELKNLAATARAADLVVFLSRFHTFWSFLPSLINRPCLHPVRVRLLELWRSSDRDPRQAASCSFSSSLASSQLLL